MDRRKFWTLLAGVPAMLFGTALAAQSVFGASGTPQPASCCTPDCCPSDCCDGNAATKPKENQDDCCPPSCCSTSCCTPAAK